MKIIKKSIYLLTLTGFIASAATSSSSSSSSGCVEDHLPPHAAQQSKLLHRHVLDTRTELNNFAVQRSYEDEPWSDVQVRLDGIVSWMKNMKQYTGCLTHSECKVMSFQTYSSISGNSMGARFPFSSRYELTYNLNTTVNLIRETYQIYVRKSEEIRSNSVSEDGIITTTLNGGNTLPPFPHSVCVNYSCMTGYGFAQPGATTKNVNVNDGITSYLISVPATYSSPNIVIDHPAPNY